MELSEAANHLTERPSAPAGPRFELFGGNQLCSAE
jgi:hypothetical protein